MLNIIYRDFVLQFSDIVSHTREYISIFHFI